MSIKEFMLVALALTAMTAACLRSKDETGEEPVQSSAPPAAFPSPSAMSASPTSTELLATASPLATWDPSGVDAFAQEGIEPGVLEITNDCVFLVLEGGQKVLPVWPEPTRWDAPTASIVFVSPMTGEQTPLHGGDHLGLGGATLSGTFSLYVTRPARVCEAQAVTTFIVSEIQIGVM